MFLERVAADIPQLKGMGGGGVNGYAFFWGWGCLGNGCGFWRSVGVVGLVQGFALAQRLVWRSVWFGAAEGDGGKYGADRNVRSPVVLRRLTPQRGGYCFLWVRYVGWACFRFCCGKSIRAGGQKLATISVAQTRCLP